MPTYASKTTVPVERSRVEIERTLARYGASAFSYGYDQEHSVVMFAAAGRKLRFEIVSPTVENYLYTPTGRRRSTRDAENVAAQEEKQRWRALALIIKAKLEAVQAGIVSFEEEFLAHILLPTGDTVGEWATPQLDEIYEHGGLPAIMPGAQPALMAGEVVNG